MTLAIFNGSPRKHTSNSKVLADHFLSGYRTLNTTENVNICYLAQQEKAREHLEIFAQSENVILVFPLYADSMPGIVKEFLEQIPRNTSQKVKRIGFVVQSGFPEAIHSIYVERYLKKFTLRNHYVYLGTVIKGGAESIRSAPASFSRKMFDQFFAMGEYFARHGCFDTDLIKKMQNPLKFKGVALVVVRMLKQSGMIDSYWKKNLKKHNAYDKRNDRPYDPENQLTQKIEVV